MGADASLYSRLEAAFRVAAGRTAFRTQDGMVVGFSDLDGLAGRYANAVAALGIRPGDRATVQIEKSLAGVGLVLGLLKAGAVLQPLNTAYTSAELDYFIGDAEPGLLVVDPARQAEGEALAARHRVPAVATLGADGEGMLADLAAASEPDFETVPRAPGDLAGLVYTSGTTGRSKGAMLTHENLSSNAAALVDLWRMRPADVLVHALPIFHVHGLYVALNTALLSGAETVWLPKFDVADVMRALAGATVMMGVPTFYTRLLAEPAFGPRTCRTMRLFISGSAPLPAAAHQAFEARTGMRILERYGMTECGMITSNPYDGERIAGTVGYALPGVSVRIGDGEGGARPAGEIGVVEVKGPNVFKGYWRMPEKTAEEIRPDGFFITGDVGVMAPDGRLSLVGRAKELIISGGFNVYPKEIESELDKIPGVAESAVVGVPHPDFGEGVIAVVIAGKSAPPSEAEIIAALATRLAKFKVPKRVFVIDALPRNAMGKIQKNRLQADYANTFARAGSGHPANAAAQSAGERG